MSSPINEKSSLYLVEVIRYGDPSLGVHRYGVFDDFSKIAKTMQEYNSYRGGKYPAYYVTPIGTINPNDDNVGSRTMYHVSPIKT